MKKLTIALLASAAVFISMEAQATIIDVEGSAGMGVNDNTATAMNVGSMVGNQFFFDIDCANDCNSNADDDLGLDTQLWIYNSAGVLMAMNDDSDFFSLSSNAGTDPGSDIYGDFDSFIGGISLNSGTYFAAVSAYQKDSNAIDQSGYGVNSSFYSDSGDQVFGVTADDSFSGYFNGTDGICDDLLASECSGSYQLQIRTTFADTPGQITIGGWVGSGTNGNDVDFYQFTVENISQGNTVPEPAPIALLGLGLLGLGLARRRRD